MPPTRSSRASRSRRDTRHKISSFSQVKDQSSLLSDPIEVTLRNGEQRSVRVSAHSLKNDGVERLTMLPKLNANFGKILPSDQVLPTLRSFYYDTAQASHPGALLSLLNLVDVSQVVFGTDFPYRTSLDHVKGLMAMGFSMNDLTAIESRNAQRLLGRA